MDNTLFGIPLVVLGFLCIGISVIYYYIWPRPIPSDPPRPPWRRFVLRWGHSLVWILLALACFIASPQTALLAGLLGIAGLVLYVVFIAAIFQDRQAASRAALARREDVSESHGEPEK